MDALYQLSYRGMYIPSFHSMAYAPRELIGESAALYEIFAFTQELSLRSTLRRF